VTVRKSVDELLSEEPVGDLGYAADQRMVATALLGLQLLADEVDLLKDRLDGALLAPRPQAQQPPSSQSSAPEATADVAAQLDELTEQLRKLTKALKKASKKR
jgi:hypothetical protein